MDPIYEIMRDRPVANKYSQYLGLKPTIDVVLPKKILMIEDDEDFAEIAAHAIEKNSHSEVTVAKGALQAELAISREVFDLVLVDWRLPILNGFKALRLVSRHLDEDIFAPESWFERRTPVIVVSACDRKQIEAEKKPHGHFKYVGYVSKEQPLRDILEKLSDIYGKGNLAT